LAVSGAGFTPRVFPQCARDIALANCQNVCFNKNDGENVNIRIDSYFRAHIDYKHPDGGWKIP